MNTLSGQIRTFTKSVKTKAETNEGMMAVVALAAVALSLAEILSRGKRRESRATSSGCKPRRISPSLGVRALQYSGCGTSRSWKVSSSDSIPLTTIPAGEQSMRQRSLLTCDTCGLFFQTKSTETR